MRCRRRMWMLTEMLICMWRVKPAGRERLTSGFWHVLCRIMMRPTGVVIFCTAMIWDGGGRM